MIKNSGAIEILILIFCVAVGFALAGGLVDTSYKSPIDPATISKQITSIPAQTGDQSLHLDTINIQTTYATPTDTITVHVDKLGHGPCDVKKLQGSFGGDVNKATIASCICAHESDSVPTVQTKTCLPENGGGTDYSIGLYQFNLLFQCGDPVVYTYHYDAQGHQVHDMGFNQGTNPYAYLCTIANQNLTNTCVAHYVSPEQNIQEMVTYSRNGTFWDEGWHAESGECF